MAYQGTTGPLPQDPVYYVGMQSGHNAVYSAPVGHGAADRPPYTLPTAPMMMPTPGRPVGCPPGLEYLTQTSQLLVHQRVEMAEIAIGWEMNNVYTVKNSMGQQVFVATEENDIFTMQACGPGRPFTIHLHDNIGQEVLTVIRPLRCTMCCFPCCLQELEVHSPPGNPIGYVEQNWHPGLPKFTILNEMRSPQLKIKGQWCDCSCMSDVIFEVMSLDESAVVGQISKQWGGFMQEGFTDADNFGISFPMDLDVKIKAVMVGACFLIDFMFFEKKPRNQH
ncbi:phospholipid scramblase 1-like isoform X1 [Dicentrarchus labrax]|uniref:Phospholipid scramblase n=1 Tax=Dicentrarchus labrax TaxID=13489 RepID=A0A8P4GMZ1_DICLA|nr:phospholipid scramblase 1-like isoform X1 [Dicentrarchus labrax]XP_051253996.1 phospholipid scramblase 1-like isoform X1 [Dicentrarchus labrax]XP_051253997.1 phospholipid scramblase 1-like isoform X1 [Dicentrarchus labrax]